MNTIRAISVAALATLLAACNTSPDRNASLENARNNLRSAQANPQVVSLAADELKRATESVGRAGEAQAKGAPVEDIDHLSYVANQRVAIAQETAVSRAAQATVASASADRDKMRLAMRTQEVDVAQAKLSESQQINAQQSTDLAAAQVATQRSATRINDLEQQLSDLGAKKTDHGMVVTLGGVLFYTGQARLLPAARQDMSKLADFFKRNPERTARIEGNTDSVGDAAANMTLSQSRADAVKEALIGLGVNVDHLVTAANGEDKPLATNATAAGRQMNRRVEVIFAPQQDILSTK